MEVKPGYKQTEVGVIPTNWSARNILEIAEYQKSRFDDGDWIEAEHISDDGYRLIQTGNIGIGEYIEKDSKKYIYESSFEKLKCKELMSGDLLICRLAEPAGRACILPDLGERKVVTAVDVTIFRPYEKVADRRYLVQYFSTSQWFKSVLEQVGGTTHKRISRSALGNIKIPFPDDLNEQRAIATTLSDMDALLDGLDRLIAKKRAIKHATMQQLLTGQTRLPGFSGEWEVRRLGNIVNIDPESLGGDTPKDFQFNYISLEDVDEGILRSYSEQVFFTSPSRARRKICENDVLVSTVRPNLKSHLLFRRGIGSWVCSTGFCVLRCPEGVIHPGYVFFHLFASHVNRQIDALLTGSNYPAINSSDVRALEIPFPGYAEQMAIATILSDMDAEITALETRCTKTHDLKQAMMQELLTGRTRLVEAAEKPNEGTVVQTAR